MGRRIQTSPTSGTGYGLGAIKVTGTVVQPSKEDANLELQGNGTGIVDINDDATVGTGTASSSTTTGSLIVDGGLGVSGSIYAGGIEGTDIGAGTAAAGTFTSIAANGGTESTTTTNGTVVVTGGVGISGNLNVGGSASINGAEIATTSTRPALGTNGIIRTNAATISENITIPSGTNGVSAGPITIAGGSTVTVSGDWSIV